MQMMLYWTDGYDSYFVHDAAEGNNPGPAIYVDGDYVCSPDWELAWTDPSGLDKQRGYDQWWGNTYSKTIPSTGQTYLVKFWNPSWRASSEAYYVYMFIYLGKMEVGKTHTVKIRGMWNINAVSTEMCEATWTTSALGSPFTGNPSAVMSDYNHMSVSGNLLSSNPGGHYSKVYVGTTNNATWGSLSLVEPDAMDNHPDGWGATTSSYSDLILPFSRNNFWDAEKKPVEYVLSGTVNDQNYPIAANERPAVKIYQWYNVEVPGFVRPLESSNPKSPTYSANLWDKTITVSWAADESNNRSKNGTWSVYRGSTLVASDIKYNTPSCTDASSDLVYDQSYTYKIYFVPDKTPAGTSPSSDLMKSVTAVLERKAFFEKGSFTASTTYTNRVALSWRHEKLENASSQNYSLVLERSTDKNNWTTLETFTITDPELQTGSFEDTQGLEAFTAYYYRLKITLWGKSYTSDIVTGSLNGMSTVTAFSASRGSYNNVVKLKWDVDQVGSTTTYYTLYRRPLGSSDESDWAELATISGTNASYSYDDVTAQIGSFNEYKVAVWAMVNGVKRPGLEWTTDGFCMSTGIISGHITYGTGVAVEGAKVTLYQQSGGEETSGMHSLQFRGQNNGLLYKTDTTTIHRFFENDFSVQMYLKPDETEMNGNGSNYLVFDALHTFTIRLWYDKNNHAYKVGGWISDNEISSISIPANEWSHISFVHTTDPSSTQIYAVTRDTVMKDTILQDVQVAAYATADRIAIGNGARMTDTGNYKGHIDEFRFFTKALTESEILRNYNHPLTGNEPGLAIYYPMDEGLPYQTLAYDFSKKNGVPNGRHAVSGEARPVSTTDLPSKEQLSLMAYTDSIGDYTIGGIPFSGEGITYSVVPELGIHEFSPARQSRFISQQSQIHNSVDFEDVSSFPVSGTIYYSGTTYPVEGVNFYVDGTICSKDGKIIESDANGHYKISVPIGDHFIEVRKDGHVFVNGGRYPEDPQNTGAPKKTFEDEITDLEFRDTTLVNFTGRIVGGDNQNDKPVGFAQSKNNIGVVKMVLEPTRSGVSMNVMNKDDGGVTHNTSTVPILSATEKIQCDSYRGANAERSREMVIQTDPATGEFSALLPPVEYAMTSIIFASNEQAVENVPLQVVDLSNSRKELSDTLYLDDGSYELYSYNTIFKPAYHTPPCFTVKQDGRDDGSFGIDSYRYVDAVDTVLIDDIYTVGANNQITYNYGESGFKAPLFIQNDPYTFNLRGFERYENADNHEVDTVALSGIVVTIENALSAEQAVYINDGNGFEAGQVDDLKANQLKLDSLGCAKYTWKAGLPNVASPYTRTISMNYDINDHFYNWEGNGMRGIILGDLPTGNNFITSGPDFMTMILRDPPGTGSSAEWSKGTVTTKSTTTGDTWSESFELGFTWHFGVNVETMTGVAAGALVAKVNYIDTDDDVSTNIMLESEGENSTTVETTTTITNTIATSGEPDYVGANGDVFVGTATNLIFGNARNIGFQKNSSGGFDLTKRDVISTGSDFTTSFSYTQDYIENTLIPNYILVRNSKITPGVDSTFIKSYKNTSDEPKYFSTLTPDDENFGEPGTYTAFAPKDQLNEDEMTPFELMWARIERKTLFSDEVKWCNNQISTWKKYLEYNEAEKVRAYNARENKDSVNYVNYSFDGGASVTHSIEKEEMRTSSQEWSVSAGLLIGDEFGFKFDGWGFDVNISNTTMGGRHEVHEEGSGSTSSFSYTFAEEAGDALTVDVYEYGGYGPIFRTRGGQTSNPYEGQVVTNYFEPGTTIMEATMQIEVPQIDVDVNTVSDVPTGSPASYTLRLGNSSEIGADVAYKLFVLDETNPYGAQLSIDGNVLTEGRLFKVPGNQTLTKTLQLRQTDVSVLDYNGNFQVEDSLYKKGIGIVFASDSQPEEIADTVFIKAFFVPSSSAVDLALSTTTMNTKTGSELLMTFSNFDRNYKGLKAFRLECKRPGSANWTQLREYLLDPDAVNSTNQEALPDGASVAYSFDMSSYADGDYLFRAVSVATYGTEEIYRYSEEIAMTKDMVRPRPLGIPEPADGILDIGDELSITFNEPIVKGELTEELNFSVTGILNGSEIAHETALRAGGGTTAVAQTESNITLANKDFSFDAWVRLSGEGTILSHGNGAMKMNIGTDASGQLIVDIAGTTYTSSKAIPTDKWSFISLSYASVGDGGHLNASVAYDATELTLFSDEPVVKYDGNGPLAVGKGMNGAIHELLLWDEAHDISTALVNRSLTKNPSTRHLIGYWKMDEGEGTEIRDYARSRHMTMADETWYINNENKAVSLDGQHFVVINTTQLNTFEGDDGAVEFWMRGGAQSGNAQIMQMGDVGLWTNTAGELQLTGKGAFKPADQMTNFATSSGNIMDNAWHHIAVNILRQGTVAVYVDGNRVLTTSSANVGTIATDKLLFGVRRTTFSAEAGEYEYDYPFTGEVDEIRVWGATLNADLLAKNRKVRLTGQESGLKAYYPFEKKTIDNNKQWITSVYDQDLTGSGQTAQLSTQDAQYSVLSYTDEAPALRVKPQETRVGFSFTASDNKIVIDIDEDPAKIEGCTLNITVEDALDKNGNYSEAAIWSAYVNRKQLAWKDDVVAVEQHVNTGSSVTATLVNKGGKLQMWTISGLPSWITVLSENGTTNPQAETTVTFNIAPAAPLGRNEVTVYATDNDNIDVPLTINVKVTGDTPDWAVDPTGYEETMNLIGSLQILNVPSQDEDDIVAAFIGDECRGVAQPTYFKRYDDFFLTMDIYGNAEDEDEPIIFKVYDASEGTIYPVVTTKLGNTNFDPEFVANDFKGTYKDPVLLNATDMIEQNIDLSKGWNWMSLSVQPDDMVTSVVFAKAARRVTMVKGQFDYDEYDGEEWLNMDMNNAEMYLASVTEPFTLNVTGHRVNPAEVDIAFKKGWNWIAYNGQRIISLAEALSEMEPQDGDIIKGQKGVAYYDEYEWIGSLKTLVPGLGYKTKNTSTTNKKFSYPASAANSSSAHLVPMREELPALTAFTPVDVHTYAENMVVIAQVVSDGMPVEGVEVGFFAGSECREAAVSDERGMVYVTVPGDSNAATLTIYLARDGQLYGTSQSIVYEPDAVCGTPRQPLLIDISSADAIDGINAATTGEQIYDIAGRKLNSEQPKDQLRRGVYIVNGQKVTVK